MDNNQIFYIHQEIISRLNKEFLEMKEEGSERSNAAGIGIAIAKSVVSDVIQEHLYPKEDSVNNPITKGLFDSQESEI